MGNRIIATDKDNDERVGILLLTTEQGFNLQNETKTLAQTLVRQGKLGASYRVTYSYAK